MSDNEDPMASWMAEKLGIVLGDLARIADIAKDPETPDWYRRRLRSHLQSAFGNTLKVLFHVLDRLEDWKPELAEQPTEHGTLGLAAQLGKHRIDHRLDVGASFDDLDEDDEEERWPPRPDAVPSAAEDPWSAFARQRIMALTFTHLMDRKMPAAERLALCWIAYHLTMSDHPDVAFLTRTFFARDIGVSEDEAESVLAALAEKKLIYRETRLDDDRRMAIKLVIEGMNDVRHEPQAN
jgi:hypothetical protein